MFDLNEYYMGRDKEFPPTEQQVANAICLLDRVGKLEDASGFDMILTSGYRPAPINAKVPGAAQNSSHTQCAGVDLSDPSGKLANFCLKNLEILEEIGLWMEDPKDAKNHVHVQIFPPKSGNRVFRA